jgi:hypothetical protein
MSESPPPSTRLERWKREDAAPRLADEAPELEQFKLEFSEWSHGRAIADSSRVRHIVVKSAAAFFEVPCGDPRCKDGGHDLTREVMLNVRKRQPTFAGRDRCSGYVGQRPCARSLQFVAHAEFDQPG